jgi:hypothetical protein
MYFWTVIAPHAVDTILNPGAALIGAPLLIAVGLWVWGKEEAPKVRSRDPENRPNSPSL